MAISSEFFHSKNVIFLVHNDFLVITGGYGHQTRGRSEVFPSTGIGGTLFSDESRWNDMCLCVTCSFVVNTVLTYRLYHYQYDIVILVKYVFDLYDLYVI